MEEVFRFSVINNPQVLSKEKLKESTIRIIDEPIRRYKIFSSLVSSDGGNTINSLELIKTFVRRAMQTNAFLRKKEQLTTKLFEFDDWIISENKNDVEAIIRFAKQLFGDFKNLVSSDGFSNDKILISDSLIAATILEPKVKSLRSRLMRMRRHFALLEYLAEEDNQKKTAKKVRKIRRATLLLPSQLFPLPNQNQERKEWIEKEQEKKRELVKKRIQEINNTNAEIGEIDKSIEELSKAYSLHFLELRNNPKIRDNSNSKLSILPKDKFNALSGNTKNLVSNKLGLKDNLVDIPYAINGLENEIFLLSKKVNYDASIEGLIGVLDTFVEVEKKCGSCKMVMIEPEKKDNNFTGLTKGYVNNVGNQRLLKVRQKLFKYEPGEIAHIENVLRGETKRREHRKLDRSEETIFEETEREEEFEKDLETTDRFELQSETSKTINRDVSKEAGVTVSYGGPVKVEAHGNYASDTSTESTRRSASTYSQDVVSRSVKKIKERVLQRRTRTTIHEVEVINKHKIDNSDPDDNVNSGHVTGIYKWVNKLYKAQVFDYGNRGTLEFLIPEPGAFYRHAMTKKSSEGNEVPKPEEPGFCFGGSFSKLKPTDLTISNYMCFVSKYGVSDITPPPSRIIVQSGAVSLHFKAEGGKQMAGDKIETIEIPSDYKANSAEYILAAGRGHRKSGPDNSEIANFGVRVTCGNHILLEETITDHTVNNPNPQGEDYTFNGKLNLDIDSKNEDYKELMLDDEEQELQLGIAYSSDINFYAILNVAITCERKPEAFQQWQIDTYSAIMNAYNGLKLNYEESLQAQTFETEINIQGQNPLINREVERTELKKHAISILTGQQYEGFNAMWQNLNQGLGYPEIDLEDAAEEGKFVQFFEQAFEWQHATYLFYDYFWGRKDTWIETLHLKDTDPLFEKFLKAGYARMWVPIRPGFEETILHYKCAGGEPWTIKPAPLCIKDGEEIELAGGYGQEPEVPLIEQLKEQLDNEFIERPGKIEVTKDSNIIQGKEGTDFTLDDVDREILINLKSYRIKAVDEANQLVTLNESFPDEDETFGVSLGATYVGEPWMVTVPTSLVWLDGENNLFNDF